MVKANHSPLRRANRSPRAPPTRPARLHCTETLSSLRFAARAKKIENMAPRHGTGARPGPWAPQDKIRWFECWKPGWWVVGLYHYDLAPKPIWWDGKNIRVEAWVIWWYGKASDLHDTSDVPLMSGWSVALASVFLCQMIVAHGNRRSLVQGRHEW